jgi:hypothetical protein
VATKKGMTINFFTPLFCGGFWIRDPKTSIAGKILGGWAILSELFKYIDLKCALHLKLFIKNLSLF